MRVHILFALFCFSPSFINAFIVHYTVERYNATRPIESESNISCTCGGKKDTKELAKGSLEQVFQSIQERNFCGEDYASDICKMVNKCHNCTAETRMCSSTANASNYDCFIKRFEMREKFLLHLKDSNHGYSRNRFSRQADSCFLPTKMNTADLACTRYPSSVACVQKCMLGYTLEKGITRKMKCLYKENVWKPTGFEECSPFIDCSMSLVRGGKLHCSSATIAVTPSCTVSCLHYEDIDAIPERKYVCSISSGWNVKLPHCVIPGGGLQLVPAPAVRLHPLVKESGRVTTQQPLNFSTQHPLNGSTQQRLNGSTQQPLNSSIQQYPNLPNNL